MQNRLVAITEEINKNISIVFNNENDNDVRCHCELNSSECLEF